MAEQLWQECGHHMPAMLSVSPWCCLQGSGSHAATACGHTLLMLRTTDRDHAQAADDASWARVWVRI